MDASHCFFGMDFINSNPCIKSLEFSPHRLVIHRALGQLETVALTEQVNETRSCMWMFRTENYTLMLGPKAESYKEPEVGDTELVPKVDLFSNHHNTSDSLNCTKENNALKYGWEKRGLCYALSSSPYMLEAVVKTVLEEARLLLVSPDWMAKGVDLDWRGLLDHLTVKRV